MKYFLDTSALVKLFHEESGTHIVESIVTDQENEIWILELVRVEFYSAMCRRYRQKEITEDNFNNVLNDFEEQMKAFNIETMSSVVLNEAEHLMTKYGRHYGLRSLDALHLGAFQLLFDQGWFFVCADETLCMVANKCGMQVKNPVAE